MLLLLSYHWFISRSGPTFEKIAFNFRHVTLCTFRSLVGGSLENCLEKNEKNRITSNKGNICTLDIMIDFHWKNEANRWRSEICLICSYADSLLRSHRESTRVTKPDIVLKVFALLMQDVIPSANKMQYSKKPISWN